MTKDVEIATDRMTALLDRLVGEAQTWKLPDGAGRPVIEKRVMPRENEAIRIHVKKANGPTLGYWRFEASVDKAFFAKTLDGDGLFAALNENMAVAYTKSLVVPRRGLKRLAVSPANCSIPPGLIFVMADVDTGEAVRVFITHTALHGELDNWQGPQDQYHARDLLRRHQHRVEEAANDKYVAEGVLGELDGKPILWIQPSDL